MSEDALNALSEMVDSVNHTHDQLRMKIDQQGKDLRSDLTGLRTHLDSRLQQLGEDLHRMDVSQAETTLTAQTATRNLHSVLEAMKEIGVQRERLSTLRREVESNTEIQAERQKMTVKWVKWLASLNAATLALLIGAAVKMLAGI